jgi:hypothetical protein
MERARHLFLLLLSATSTIRCLSPREPKELAFALRLPFYLPLHCFAILTYSFGDAVSLPLFTKVYYWSASGL